MTLEEVASSLPNGFHDAELQRFEMDYVHRTLRLISSCGSAMTPEPKRPIAPLA
jgi:hypothetical protein